MEKKNWNKIPHIRIRKINMYKYERRDTKRAFSGKNYGIFLLRKKEK